MYGSTGIILQMEPGSMVITGQVPTVLFPIIILLGGTLIHIQVKEVTRNVHPHGVATRKYILKLFFFAKSKKPQAMKPVAVLAGL